LVPGGVAKQAEHEPEEAEEEIVDKAGVETFLTRTGRRKFIPRRNKCCDIESSGSPHLLKRCESCSHFAMSLTERVCLDSAAEHFGEAGGKSSMLNVQYFEV
jgi:hypothetical protein